MPLFKNWVGETNYFSLGSAIGWQKYHITIKIDKIHSIFQKFLIFTLKYWEKKKASKIILQYKWHLLRKQKIQCAFLKLKMFFMYCFSIYFFGRAKLQNISNIVFTKVITTWMNSFAIVFSLGSDDGKVKW